MGHRKQQLAMLIVAGVVLQFSVMLLAVQMVLPPDPDGSTLVLIIMAVAGLILGLAGVLVAAFALLGDQRPVRPTATEQGTPPTRPPAPPAAPAQNDDGHTTVINPGRQNGSPRTPPDADRADGGWATATTPWPRANEADPDGTLIRPPHR